MIAKAKLKKRLERLEQTIQVRRDAIASDLMQRTLAELSDEDLDLLEHFLRRGPPFISATLEEKDALVRWAAAEKTVKQRIRDQSPSLPRR